MTAVSRAVWGAAGVASRTAIWSVADYRLIVAISPPPAAIYVAPHRSMFDIPVGVSTFRKLDVRPLVVVSRSYLARWRLERLDWPSVGVLPIDPGPGGRTRLLTEGGRALAAGTPVAIMPEGRVARSGAVPGGVKSGAAQLATETGAPVVVLGSAGTESLWRGTRASIVAAVKTPVVVMCHSVVWPDTTLDRTHANLLEALRMAEAAARAALSEWAGMP